MCISKDLIRSQVAVAVSEVADTYRQVSKSDSISKKAYFYARLKLLKGAIEGTMESLKNELLVSGCDEKFLEDDLKVFIRDGAKITTIDKQALFDDLAGQKRVADYVKVSTVTQKSISDLSDGKLLIAKYVKDDGNKAPSLIVSTLTEEDIAKLKKI